MSLRIPPPPTQGSGLNLTPYFFEDETQAGLKAKIEAAVALGDIPDIMESNPKSWLFTADVQYQVAQKANNTLNYSVLIIVGEWGAG